MWLLLQLEAVGGAYDSPYTRAVAGSNPAAPTMCDQHVRVLHDRLVSAMESIAVRTSTTIAPCLQRVVDAGEHGAASRPAERGSACCGVRRRRPADRTAPLRP